MGKGRPVSTAFFIAWSLVVVASVVSVWLLYSSYKDGWSIYGDSKIDFAVTGQFGDFIGGVVGTIISLAGFVFLYITLQKQREAFQRERFDNKFYELLNIHRANVNEISLDGRVQGRLAFLYMINELRHIYHLIVHATMIESFLFSEDDEIENEKKTINLAYKVFFFGIGFSSRNQLTEIISDEENKTFQEVKEVLLRLQKEYAEFRKCQNENLFVKNADETGESKWFTLEVDYLPFRGHALWLGHYFRHLFQLVRFVHDQPKNILTKANKREYLKTVRAQLSNEEQALLYYNSLSSMGAEWHKKGFFTKYFLLKNLPLGLIDIGPHPHTIIGIADKDKILL